MTEYFWLNQDKRISNTVFLSQKFQRTISYQDILAGKVDVLPNISAYFATKNQYNWFPSVLNKQIFMVTKPIKEVFTLFCPEMQFKTICVVDNPNNQFEYYYVPILPMIDALSKESDTNLDKSSIRKVVLASKKLCDTPIFRLTGIKDQVVLVTLEVAECLMRRPIRGFTLQRTFLEGE